MADETTPPADTAIATGTDPAQNSPLLAPVDPAAPELAPGAAEAATPTVQDTGIVSGYKVITTPQGKASVDVSAPDFVTNAFQEAAIAAGSVPVYDESGKRIVGSQPAPKNPRGKGMLAVTQSMVTLENGRSYTSNQFVDPKDLSPADKDALTTGDSPALVPYGG